MIEVLVVLQALPEAEQRERMQQLQAHCQVVSTMGRRLLVGRVAPHAVVGLRTLGGVAAVVENTTELAALHLRDALSDTERLFAAAWAAQGQKSGPRAGDRLDWDAPGFDPPGDPTP